MMCAAFRKDIVENNYMLDVGEFVKMGILKPGEIKLGKVVLAEDFEFHLTADLTPIDRGVIIMEFTPNITQHINVVTSKPNFGGYRYWFQCPETGKKCTKLYYDYSSGYFVSREILGLGYRSQRLSMKSRFAERAKSIRAKLGGEAIFNVKSSIALLVMLSIENLADIQTASTTLNAPIYTYDPLLLINNKCNYYKGLD